MGDQEARHFRKAEHFNIPHPLNLFFFIRVGLFNLRTSISHLLSSICGGSYRMVEALVGLHTA